MRKKIGFFISLCLFMNLSQAEVGCYDLFQANSEPLTIGRRIQKVEMELVELFAIPYEEINFWDRLTSAEARHKSLLQTLRIRERQALLKKKNELRKIESLILSCRSWVELTEEEEAQLVGQLLFNGDYQKALKEINAWMNSSKITSPRESFMYSSFIYIMWGPQFSLGRIPLQHWKALNETLGRGDIHQFIGLSFQR